MPYSADVVLPTATPEMMLNHALTLDRVGVLVEKDNSGKLCVWNASISRVDDLHYRNNIQHLFVLPSLVASIILHYEAIQKDLLVEAVGKIYPSLKGEHLHFSEEERETKFTKLLMNLRANR